LLSHSTFPSTEPADVSHRLRGPAISNQEPPSGRPFLLASYRSLKWARLVPRRKNRAWLDCHRSRSCTSLAGRDIPVRHPTKRKLGVPQIKRPTRNVCIRISFERPTIHSRWGSMSYARDCQDKLSRAQSGASLRWVPPKPDAELLLLSILDNPVLV